jgi:hypothetical protein
LNAILQPLQTVEVPFGAETVRVAYRPDYMTPAFEERLRALNESERPTETFLELFEGLVAAWDLKREETDAEPIPIRREALREIPYSVLSEVLRRVQEAVVPNPQTGNSSDVTSLQADTSGESPTGTF